MIVLYYLVIINVLGFYVMWLDKQKAKLNRWRIPEASLHTLAWIGAAPAMLWARQVLRHKSRKKSFGISFTTASLLWIAIVLFFF